MLKLKPRSWTPTPAFEIKHSHLKSQLCVSTSPPTSTPTPTPPPPPSVYAHYYTISCSSEFVQNHIKWDSSSCLWQIVPWVETFKHSAKDHGPILFSFCVFRLSWPVICGSKDCTIVVNINYNSIREITIPCIFRPVHQPYFSYCTFQTVHVCLMIYTIVCQTDAQ